MDAFQTDRSKKEASHEVFEEKRKEKEAIREQTQKETPPEPPALKPDSVVRAQSKLGGLKTVGKIDLDPIMTGQHSMTESLSISWAQNTLLPFLSSLTI